MSNLILFEMKKFVHKKKSLLSILVFMILTVAFVGLNMTLDQEKNSSKESSIIYQMESIQDALTQLEAELKMDPDNSHLIQIKESYMTDYNLLDNMKKALVSQNVKQYLNDRITYNTKQVNEILSGDTISFEGTDEMEQQIVVDKYLLDHDIKPINETASMQGFNFIKLFLDRPMSIIFIILIIILAADIMSSEYDMSTYKLLFTQPIGKIKIVISKLVALFIMINVSISGVILLVFGVTSILNGFGTPKYPTLLYINNVTEYIGIGKVIMLECIVYEMIIIFLCVFSMFMSCICKNSTSAVSIAIIIVVAGYMLSGISILNEVANINPFTYFDISSVVSGKIAETTGNSNVTWINGVLITWVWSVLIYISNIVYVKRKQL